MALRRQQSTAHEYDVNNQCVWCHMYRVNVESMSHVCTQARETLADRMFNRLADKFADKLLEKLEGDKSGK
jgi:hypothetical protein